MKYIHYIQTGLVVSEEAVPTQPPFRVRWSEARGLSEEQTLWREILQGAELPNYLAEYWY
jgi:hypothetical protein